MFHRQYSGSLEAPEHVRVRAALKATAGGQ
jgi:hypothetical protein